MKNKILVLVLAVMVVGLVHLPASALVNGSFEMGNFIGWTPSVPTGGSASVVGYHSGCKIGYYGAKEGEKFALLGTGGAETPVIIRQTILNVNAGDVLSGWAAFDTNDYYYEEGTSILYNDNAWVRIFDTEGEWVTPWYDDVEEVGDLYCSPWTYWDWTASRSGNYILEFGVTNVGDPGGAWDSFALFDGNVHTPVAEPASMLLLGAGLLGMIGLRKKFN